MGSYNAASTWSTAMSRRGAGQDAFIDSTRRLTYGELADGVARVAPMLARLGLAREDASP